MATLLLAYSNFSQDQLVTHTVCRRFAFFENYSEYKETLYKMAIPLETCEQITNIRDEHLLNV